jgi:hypothetical protein
MPEPTVVVQVFFLGYDPHSLALQQGADRSSELARGPLVFGDGADVEVNVDHQLAVGQRERDRRKAEEFQVVIWV